MIHTRKLRRLYGETAALHELDLDVSAGEILGFLGPNGAGKSTTVKILAGMIKPTSGEARVAGFDIVTQAIEVKQRIGYVPESSALYESLTAREYLHLVASLHHQEPATARQRIDELLERFDLAAARDQRLTEYSKGMKQKVLIASALMHRPDVLFLDEPLTGLDANAALVVKELLRSLAAQGRTIFFCSHILEVVEMEGEDTRGIQLSQFAHRRAPAIEMGGIDCQPHIVTPAFRDDLGGCARRTDAAPSKAQKLKGQPEVVLPGEVFDDSPLSGMPHARIVRIDVSRALEQPGVYLALGALKDKRAVESLTNFLSTTAEQWQVRANAALALGLIGDAHAVRPLIAALQDTNPDVRRAATTALGELKDPGSLELFVKMLDDPDPGLHRHRLRLRFELRMPHRDDVLAGRHVGDLEMSGAVARGEIRVREDDDEPLHLRVDPAEQGIHAREFRALAEHVLLGLPLGPGAEVELLVIG